MKGISCSAGNGKNNIAAERNGIRIQAPFLPYQFSTSAIDFTPKRLSLRQISEQLCWQKAPKRYWQRFSAQ
jgi:hypothetical protein